MSRNERSAFTCICLYIAYSVFVLIIEIKLIEPGDRSIYCLLKLLTLALAVPAALILRRDVESFRGNLLFAISLTTYSCVGLWYRPLYGFAYAEMILVFAFAFTPSRKLFYSTVVLGATSIIAIYIYRFEYLVKLLQNPAFADVPLTIGAFSVIAIYVYISFSQEKLWREAALTRFGLVGQHSSTLVHDLKGQLAIPIMQIEALERKCVGRIESHAFLEIKESLYGISRSIGSINQMSRLAQKEAEWFSVRSVFLEAMALLKPKLSTVKMEMTGDFECLGNSALMSSIVLALFINSFESFGATIVSRQKIWIDISKGKIRFADNGGGFDRKTLSALASGRPVSGKEAGTGIGLYLVRNGLAEMGGSVKFANAPNCGDEGDGRFPTVESREIECAVAKISISKRCWRSSS